MDDLNRLLRLLGQVLPHFAHSAQAAEPMEDEGSDLWLAMTQLRAGLTSLRLLLPALKSQFQHSGSSIQSRESCIDLLQRILQDLETLVTENYQEVNIPGHAYISFPRLCTLAVETNAERASRHASFLKWELRRLQQFVKQLDEWNIALNDLSPLDRHDRTRKGSRSRPLQELRGLFNDFHACMSKNWCSCGVWHESMLSVSSYRALGDEFTELDFDILFNADLAICEASRHTKVHMAKQRDIQPRKGHVKFQDPQPSQKIATFHESKRENAVCSALAKSQQRCCLNLHFQAGTLFRGRSSPEKLGITKFSRLISLGDILAASTMLHPRTRLLLAVLLSTSTLHLQGSTLLSREWSKDTIYFVQAGNRVRLKPLIKSDFRPVEPHQLSSIPIAGENPTRINLGIILLEIFLQERIENRRNLEEDTNDGVISLDTDWFTASRVHDCHNWELREKYGEAVGACLDIGANFDQTSDFSSFYDKIVKPLEEALFDEYHIPPQEVDGIVAKLDIDGFRHSGSSDDESISEEESQEEDSKARYHAQKLPILDSGSRKCSANMHPSRSDAAAMKEYPPADDGADSSQRSSLKRTAALCSTYIMGEAQVPLKKPKNSLGTLEDSNGSTSNSFQGNLSEGNNLSNVASGYDLPVEMELEEYTEQKSHKNADFGNSLTLRLGERTATVGDIMSSTTTSSHCSDKWFTRFRTQVIPLLPTDHKKHPRISIAVLDTGIDDRDPIIFQSGNRIRKVEDFVKHENPDIQEDNSHGTHVASILLRVATGADIYVAKVTKDGKLRSPNSVAKAIIYAAMEWKVDMITMSFGLKPLTSDIECIKEAIQAAARNNVVMFAAANNDGGNEDITFPANQITTVICMNATDGFGNSWSGNPTLKPGCKFGTLGHEVLVSLGGRNVRVSGTSYSTPIAAGIAALVMDYLEQKHDKLSDLERILAAKIQSREGVVAVFEKLMCDKRQGILYITPWKLFSPDNERPVSIKDQLLHCLKRI